VLPIILTTFAAYNINTKKMEIELIDLMAQLQGNWKRDTDEQTILIIGNDLTVFADSKPDKTSFEIIRHMQFKKWQIKVVKPMAWLRTFIIDVTPDSFLLYDFDLTVNVAMAQRSRMLNPTRVYKYTRVAGE